MMTNRTVHTLLTHFIASVWLVNGLICKVLNMVPRHQQIVASILGAEHARVFTILIGCAEILMAAWIWSRIQTRLNTIVQITIIGIMNSIEFVLVPELLLWGRVNALFAFLLILIIYVNEFYFHSKSLQRN